MKKRIWSIWLALGVCLAIVAPASATIITVEVTGTVDSIITDGGLTLDGSVIVGSEMNGYCTYDSETPDLNPIEENGKYALLSISMTVGNYTFTPDPTLPEYLFFGVGTGDHGYSAWGGNTRFDGTVYLDATPYSYEDIDWSIRSLELMDLLTNSDEYILTDALPDLDSWPELSIFDWRREFEVAFHKSYSYGYGDFVIRGEITSLTVVPEPATVLLLGLGSLALLRNRRFR